MTHITPRLALSMLLTLTLACSFGGLVSTLAPGETPTSPTSEATAALADPTTTPSGPAVLLFTIGMHIEPLGTTHQGFPSGRGGNYAAADGQFFQKHVQDIQTVTDMIEAHGGRMTVQAQSPFTDAAIAGGNTILGDLAARGHEIALHFHEDAHLGRNSETLSPAQWCAVMQEEIALITQSSGVTDIRYWSGGNLYPQIFEAAACAGLDVNSDWKNPKIQETDLSLVGVNPWRPAGGTDGTDFSLLAAHDPAGAVVFLPEGQYDTTDFASMRRSNDAGGDAAYFDFLAESLRNSVAAARADRVNVFHFTVHPGEFRGDPQHPFAVIEKFLTEVVDPLVASGQVRWATFSEMADAFAAWEAANPGVAPRE